MQAASQSMSRRPRRYATGDRLGRPVPPLSPATARGERRSAAGGACGLVEDVGVALDDVDLPRLLAGAGDPDLVLDGVAAGGVFLGGGRQSRGGQAGGRGGDLAGGLDLDAEVVHPGGLAGGALDQDELERRLGDREVGVAGAALGWLGAE